MVDKPKEQDKDFKYFVRIANTDLQGAKHISVALTKIKGVSDMFANMACRLAKVDPQTKTGSLKDDQVKKLDEVILDPKKHNAPSWLLNRQNDPDSGETKHLLTSNLTFTHENDIKKLKTIKSYRGIRHGVGLPLRGQRTKSNFRRNKGKGSLGVKKKAGAKSGRT